MILQYHSWVYTQRKQKDTCNSIFIASLFAIAKTQKPPKYPLTDEQIKKMWHMYTMKYYSANKKDEIAFVAMWMGLQIIILSTK